MKIFSSHENISDKKFRELCSSKPSSLACLPLLMHIPWASRCQAFAVISLSSGLSSGGHTRGGTLKAVTYFCDYPGLGIRGSMSDHSSISK